MYAEMLFFWVAEIVCWRWTCHNVCYILGLPQGSVLDYEDFTHNSTKDVKF